MTATTMPSRPNALQGLVLPVGILAVVAMMVLPLPIWLLDIFFVFNILLALLVLMVALHSYRPLDFSSFPSVLLIATVLRLALNVASTRIVLTDGHTGPGAAGRVIEAFGTFVIAGNFAVGLVIFVILMIINLMVITKGAGRVSEVSARFTLDAMPGKQMAIDADLNAGLLTPDEARARRSEVSEEADFYGAMDGASKFVKGDAVAGILILLANILGGIAIGMAQHGLAFGVAVETYVLLSIGDGLVAQIPSLLLSIATAIIVTRVSSAHDMSSHIGRQVNLSRAWVPVAIVMLMMGLVPGMPNLLFLFAGLVAAGVAWLAVKNGESRATEEETDADTRAAPSEPGLISVEDVTDYAPVTLQLGYGLLGLIDENEGGGLVSRVTSVRREVSSGAGFVIPGVRIRDDLGLGTNAYRIRIRHSIVAEDVIYPDRKLALPGSRSRRRLEGIEARDPSFGMEAVWIMPHQQAEAEADDHVVVEPESVIVTHLSQILLKHAAELLGQDDVQALLDNLERHSPTLVQSVVPKLVPLHLLTSVMRHLLADRFPISDMPRILEGLAEIAGRTADPVEMAEALRPALVAQFLQEITPVGQAIPVVTLVPELETVLQRSVQPDGWLMLEPGLAAQIAKGLSDITDRLAGEGRQPVLVVAAKIRRPLAAVLKSHGLDATVLAINELPDHRRIEIVGNLGQSAALPSAAGGEDA
ncbi:flagellar biosynthesis protein FlhA [Roseovarius sp.]|jgi:flagellar biosynthesis protein FlhA